MDTPGHKPVILLVDDNAAVLETLAEEFNADYDVRTASSGPEAIEIARREENLATVVMDIKMAKMDGLTAARQIRNIRPDTPIILHTAYPGEYDEQEIDASDAPYDYIQKGRTLPRLKRTVRNAVESYRLKTDSKSLALSAETDFGMIGRSPAMQDVFRTMRRVVLTDNKVMVLGETGTGKELVARGIHCHSLRKDKRLGILNCNHKAADLVESELFGHTRGAFTGAVESRIGLFEYASGGTVFLDEIGDLDMTTQAKLLRVLETGEFQRVGASDMGTTDVRLLCATHCDLPDMVAKRKFRQDLYYRLKGIQIVLPPLRERREDIEPLIETFSARFTIENGIPPKLFDRAAKEYMMEYNWPGNVRQLMDAVESLIVLTDSEIIFEGDVARYLKANPHPQGKRPVGLTERMREQERIWILEALLRANRNITAAAKILNIDRSTLQKKIKSQGIDIALIGDTSD